MRTDTNKIALRAIRHLFAGARPFEIEIDDHQVACSLTPAKPAPWPTDLGGVDEASDGPWPSGVTVDCRWGEGEGHCRLYAGVYYWSSGPNVNDLCIQVGTDHREVVFVNVSTVVDEVEDGGRATLGVRFFVLNEQNSKDFWHALALVYRGRHGRATGGTSFNNSQ